MQIKIFWVGKTKNASVVSMVSDYLDRIRRFTACEIVEIRDLSKRRSLRSADIVAGEGNEIIKHLPEHGRLIVLDEKGTQYTSLDFARWFAAEQNRGARLITFIIGGPEGISSRISDRAHMTLSLGKMTWTHEMCRVLLLEQIYRALSILHNIPYHRGG
jgi:23S rRNA (pseudouridine1915-N3)-methyltransferase